VRDAAFRLSQAAAAAAAASLAAAAASLTGPAAASLQSRSRSLQLNPSVPLGDSGVWGLGDVRLGDVRLHDVRLGDARAGGVTTKRRKQARAHARSQAGVGHAQGRATAALQSGEPFVGR
jgi:hypothetical protein